MQDWNNIPNNIVPLENERNRINTQLEEVTQGFQDWIADSFTNQEQSEVLWNDWKYLELYEKQNKVAKELEQRAEENNIKDRDWSKLFFNPSFLKFDDDIVIYSGWMPSVQPYLFSMKDWTYEEIPLLPEKIYYDGKNGIICRNIGLVENWVYSIELVHIKNGRVEQRKWSDYNEVYYIDKSWKILNQVWKLWTYLDDRGISHERHERENSRWFRELQEEDYEWNKNIKSKLTIFDKKFNVLFTINSREYQVQYCDEEICICQDKKAYFPKKYIIVDKTWIIAQWTEDELKLNEHMQKFLEGEEKRQKKRKENEDKEREKRKIPFGERFKEINHCIILQDKERQTAIIQNDKWKVLYEIWDVLDFYEDDYNPEIRTRDWNLRMAARNKNSNILLVQKYEGGYHKKSIFINKTTWEKLEFDWIKWVYSFLHEKLIEVFVNWNDSEIYDGNLNKLWMRIWSGYGLYAVARQENWETKAYLYNSNTWEQLCEIENGHSDKTIKRTYRGDDWKDHLIIEKKDWTLIEVSP